MSFQTKFALFFLGALVVWWLTLQFLKFRISMKDWQEKRRWVTGGIPANINWALLLSPEIQKLLPDKKRNAVTLYWKHSKLKLKDAENAIDYAILYPDRVAAEAARMGVAPQKNKPKAGINWDVLHSPEI